MPPTSVLAQIIVTISPLQEVFPARNEIVPMILPAAKVGQAYLTATTGYKFGVAGGTPPYTFQESPLIPLPPGMTLSSAGVAGRDSRTAG